MCTHLAHMNTKFEYFQVFRITGNVTNIYIFFRVWVLFPVWNKLDSCSDNKKDF